MTDQLTLFGEQPKPRKPTPEWRLHGAPCPHGGITSGIYAGPFDCLTCNHAAVDRWIAWCSNGGDPAALDRFGRPRP